MSGTSPSAPPRHGLFGPPRAGHEVSNEVSGTFPAAPSRHRRLGIDSRPAGVPGTMRPASGRARLTRPGRGLKGSPPSMSEPHASPSSPVPEVPPAADPLGRVRALLRPGTRVRTTGLQGAARGTSLARLSRELRAPLVCITADEDSAEQLAADLAFFLGGPGIPRRAQRPAASGRRGAPLGRADPRCRRGRRAARRAVPPAPGDALPGAGALAGARSTSGCSRRTCSTG